MAVWNNWFSNGLFRRNPGEQRLEPRSGRLTKRSVTDDSAMQISTVFACVRLIAETVAGLPLDFYKVSPDKKKALDTTHPLYRLLRWKPNRYQTGVEFRETMVSQLAFRGNSYCAIERSSNGQIVSLMPLMTAQVETILGNDGSVMYRYTSNKGTAFFAEQNIWHLKLFGNGVVGLSPLDQARNTLGVAISAEDRTNQLANSGFKPTGVLMIDKVLSKEQRERIRETFKSMADNGDDVLHVLEAGMQYQQISMNPKDVQLLETRRFQTEDIARFFNVPTVLINDMSATTVWGSGITEIIRGWYKLGLRPYLERIENSLAVHLLKIEDRGVVVPKFDLDMLLRGDEKSRYEGYKVAISSGVMTPNECRDEEGLSPVESGDKPFIDRQLIYLENGGMSDEQAQTAAAGAGQSQRSQK